MRFSVVLKTLDIDVEWGFCALSEQQAFLESRSMLRTQHRKRQQNNKAQHTEHIEQRACSCMNGSVKHCKSLLSVYCIYTMHPGVMMGQRFRQ